ncbi:alpha-glucosidase [Clostridiaceae bacterium]|nr:alpha-glucosidase [Clostridiaceae bacterium]RKI15364.1 alpha-glucosidase [bacterium 1XD21-70]
MKKEWWHGKTAYQIYPKSFYDSNGDGVGDIPGITAKLDYLKELGIDMIWISPVYLSPCADQGYDIADYYQIDPVFGTMEDMDRLLEEAKRREIAVVMDLVVNHCSDEHEWFRKACADPEGEYGKYFYLEKKKDGKLPCNWRSYFGGPVWEPVPGSDWYYLHVFHKKQPDLNWENPVVRERIYEMVNWWLDKGLAGFRIDAIINIKKPQMFKDYPADREDGLCDMGTVLADTSGIGDFLREMRDRTFRPHGAFSVGEVFNAKDGELADFAGEDGYFSSIFDFRQTVEGKSVDGWHAARVPTPEDYKRCCFESQREMEGIGFYSNIIENHDEPRGVSHYLPKEARNTKGKKLLAALYFMLKGLPFIYQGQELGMENSSFASIDEVDDISSKEEYQVCLEAGLSREEAMAVVSRYSRDNARTPFQWSGEENGGFTTGVPWLGLNGNYRQINLEQQRKDPDSVFAFYQKLIRLRKDPKFQEAIVYGRTEPVLEEEPGVMAYFRQGNGQRILVAGNFGQEARTVWADGVEEGKFRLLLGNGEPPRWNEKGMVLEALQVVIGVVKEA